MALVLQLILGLLLLGSFIACYFSSKYWHWAQVLLVETIFLLGLGYLILAGEVFRIQGIYGVANQKNVTQIDRLKPQVDALEFGTDDLGLVEQFKASEIPVLMKKGSTEEEGHMLSVSDVSHQLALVTRLRGRVWRDAEPAALDAATLTATLRIPAPDPHGIEQDAILYVFEQGEAAAPGEKGPQYIGEFRVVNIAPQQIQVQPASQFDARAMDRFQKTPGPWIMYENMPIDQHPDGVLEIFAGATPEELKQLVPPQSLEEYARQGTPANPDDDDWHRDGYDESGNLVKPEDWNNTTQFRYRRGLRDYNLIFQELSQRFTEMVADRNALTEDNKHIAKALVSAKQLQVMREQEQAKLQNDLAGATKDRQAIEAHQAQVETQLANAQGLLADLVKENAALAKQLNASIQ